MQLGKRRVFDMLPGIAGEEHTADVEGQSTAATGTDQANGTNRRRTPTPAPRYLPPEEAPTVPPRSEGRVET